jgi:Zn-dependent protease with chaperone function
MIKFNGIYFDGKSSLPRHVMVFFDGVLVHIEGPDMPKGYKMALSDCIITPAIGKTNRTIKFPDGAICEADDLISFRKLEEQAGVNKAWRLVHLLESHWKAVALCAICLILFTAAFARYGIPFLAGQVASRIPPEMMRSISNNALKFLDKQFLDPSELPDKKRLNITKLFQQTSLEVDPKTRYTLEFRKGKRLGANALALPSGIVVITDELIGISQNDREIAGIFAHEITHIKKHHAMRHLLQSTGVFFLVSVLVGDIASITSVAATLPTLLVESGYSREFEREADKEAGLYLIHKGWGTKPYQDMLNNLTKSHPDLPDLGILSTHPETMKRIKALQEIEVSAKKYTK